jgi:hypothetical protein
MATDLNKHSPFAVSEYTDGAFNIIYAPTGRRVIDRAFCVWLCSELNEAYSQGRQDGRTERDGVALQSTLHPINLPKRTGPFAPIWMTDEDTREQAGIYYDPAGTVCAENPQIANKDGVYREVFGPLGTRITFTRPETF